ncbi:MAG TPA: RsmD family RNA methyltransferase [Dongiaceae bacterium]|nr:RsmD family RNA methyltransferase [Dongiaceae bacterium]
MTPVITREVHEALRAATGRIECSLDLGRTNTRVEVGADSWNVDGVTYPFIAKCKDRTIYYWDGETFEPVSRYSGALIKLVPTEWGPPTFEIDGIKMLPSAQLSPYEDARRKVDLIQPEGKNILDTCGGLGYFASWCVQRNARQITSIEKNPDVIWIRSHNPWSPTVGGNFELINGDSAQLIPQMPDGAFDAILHDPPRFGIAGELYSQVFYNQLARVLKRKGRLFHYTGTPNKLTSGRDVPNEVAKRLREAGFSTDIIGDGVLAIKK